MRIGSLFSGIGGLELGLERAGVGRTVWQCEIDPYARAVLAKHWPDAIRFDDVTKLYDVPPVDVICGGFPCQDISNAGRREGIGGSRSGLFYELMRVVRLVRPRFVVLENVAALLGRGMGDVLGELSESGYDAEWDCVPASAVGAPHQRDRVFIVAYAERRGLQTCGSTRSRDDADVRERYERAGYIQATQESSGCAHVADASIMLRDGGEHHAKRDSQRGQEVSESGDGSGAEDVADADCQRVRIEDRPNSRFQRRAPESPKPTSLRPCDGPTGVRHVGPSSAPVADADQRGQSRRRQHDAGWGALVGTQRERGWLPEPDVGRVAHGVPSRVDRLKCLGNAVVPQVAEVVGRRLMEIARQ